MSVQHAETTNHDPYILERDWRAQARLNGRHMLFRLTQGYILHPAITLNPGARVADIGCGTCIWPIDLQNELSIPIQFDAIDISLAQCPPKLWLPEGCRTIAHDAYEPFPNEMLGQYDLVHIQSWVCIWRDSTAKQLIENLISLLKPGGFLQWNEQDPTVNCVISPSENLNSTSGTREVMALMNRPRGDINFRWVPSLGDILAEYLEVVSFERKEVSRQHQAFWNPSVFDTFVEFTANLEHNARSEEDLAEVSRLKEVKTLAASELLEGAGIQCGIVVAVAKKPSY